MLIADALTFDYSKLAKKHFNYLSCDINPTGNTFTALKRAIESGITFDIITFEHDYYTGIDSHVRRESRIYLNSRDYRLERADIEVDYEFAIDWLEKTGICSSHARNIGSAPFEDGCVR